jgi:hypothetical protein
MNSYPLGMRPGTKLDHGFHFFAAQRLANWQELIKA